MKLVLISDTHGKHEEVRVPDGDVLIHAGDLTMVGNAAEYYSVADWLNAQPHKHIIVIAGNHDFGSDLLFYSMLDPRIHYLSNSGVELDGVKFWGSPVTPRFGAWAHMLPRNGEEIKECWNKIPLDTRVLITHGPPKGVLDMTIAGDNAGCEELFDVVTHKVQPELHVFGHIHEGYGSFDTQPANGPLYVNASIVNEFYRVANTPVVVEI